MSVGFQGPDEESLRKAKAHHPTAVPERTERSTTLVRAAQRKNADKALRRAVRNYVETGTDRAHLEMRHALMVSDEANRE